MDMRRLILPTIPARNPALDPLGSQRQLLIQTARCPLLRWTITRDRTFWLALARQDLPHLPNAIIASTQRQRALLRVCVCVRARDIVRVCVYADGTSGMG